MIQSGVYCILNVETGMRYVGSTKNLDFRQEQHFHRLELGTHHNFGLQQAFNDSGDVWAWIVLEYCDPRELLAVEQKWINRAVRLGRAFNIDLMLSVAVPEAPATKGVTNVCTDLASPTD